MTVRPKLNKTDQDEARRKEGARIRIESIVSKDVCLSDTRLIFNEFIKGDINRATQCIKSVGGKGANYKP
jgi:hypothetical protein